MVPPESRENQEYPVSTGLMEPPENPVLRDKELSWVISPLPVTKLSSFPTGSFV
jgi:hypothetical protein